MAWHWQVKDNMLTREFTFKDFKQALAFINEVGIIAEEQQHHPEINNVYNRVSFRLTTHDAGNTVTEKDVKLAHAIDSIAHRYV